MERCLACEADRGRFSSRVVVSQAFNVDCEGRIALRSKSASSIEKTFAIEQTDKRIAGKHRKA